RRGAGLVTRTSLVLLVDSLRSQKATSSLVTCHLSLVTCYLSLVACYLSLVTCHLLLVTESWQKSALNLIRQLQPVTSSCCAPIVPFDRYGSVKSSAKWVIGSIPSPFTPLSSI